MLASDEGLNEVIWKNLLGFLVLREERVRPGTQALATHSSMRTSTGYLPVLAIPPCSNGEVLFMGTDAAWRWRRGVEDTTTIVSGDRWCVGWRTSVRWPKDRVCA